MKAFSIGVRFDMPQAGTIPIAAANAEEAEQKVKMMLANCRNVEIIDKVEVPIASLVAELNSVDFDARDFAEDAEVVEEDVAKKAN